MNSNLPAQALLDLMAQRRFGVGYQPIVSIDDGAIIGYEALARFYGANDTQFSPQQVFE